MNKLIINVDQNLTELLRQIEKPILVDFWASWCAPCRRLAPVLDELAVEWKERLQIIKLDVDENREEAEKYHVKSIPLLLLFHKEKQLATLSGRSVEQLQQQIEEALSEITQE